MVENIIVEKISAVMDKPSIPNPVEKEKSTSVLHPNIYFVILMMKGVVGNDKEKQAKKALKEQAAAKAAQELASEIKKRIELYKTNRPYHDQKIQD